MKRLLNRLMSLGKPQAARVQSVAVAPRSPARLATIEPLEGRVFLSGTPIISIQNLDGIPGVERMFFNRIQKQPPAPHTDPATGKLIYPPRNVVHDKATLKLTNKGSAALSITSLTISGPWKIINSPLRTLAIGASTNVTLQFIAQVAPKYTYNETNGPYNPTKAGAYIGSLSIGTNDPNHTKVTEQLAGWWQEQSEASEEPNLQSLINLLGNYKTNINSTKITFLDETNGKKLYGEEVNSAYWARADSTKSVYVRAIAAWHNQGSAVPVSWYQKLSRTTHALFTVAGVEGQSLLPHKEGNLAAVAEGSFTNTGTFGFKIDYEWSDDKRNQTGGGGHHIRFFPVRDHLGNKIPNTYFMCLDYSVGANAVGENFDFQDLVCVVSNIKPMGN